MNKKFLSAILFGALMVTATGTFVSCKDYDDDIDEINKTLTDLKSQIAALQTEVDGGNWVTDLTDVEGGFKVTFNNGKTYTIVNGEKGDKGDNGTNGKGTEVKITEDGYWEIDGTKTEYIAVKKDQLGGNVKVPTVDGGFWVYYDAEGNPVKSEYKANGAAYAVDANGKYTMYLPTEDGKEMVKIELPKYVLTSIEVIADQKTTLKYFSVGANGFTDKITKKEYKAGEVIALMDENGVVGIDIAAVTNPVAADLSSCTFNLIASDASTIFGDGMAREYDGELLSRAASAGLKNINFSLKDGQTDDKNFKRYTVTGSDAKYPLLAVVAGGVSSDYVAQVTISSVTALSVTASTDTYVKVGTEYSIFGKDDSKALGKGNNKAFLSSANVISLNLTVADKDVEAAYDIKVSDNKFTIGKYPISGKVTFNVNYTDENGKQQSKSVTVNVVKDAITGDIVLSQTHTLTSDASKQTVVFSLDNVYNALTADQKLLWKSGIATLTAINFESATLGTNGKPAYKPTMEPTFVKKNTSGNWENVTSAADATGIQITVDPAETDVTADRFTAAYTFIGSNDASFKVATTIELTLKNPNSITRVPVLFSGDNAVAYGEGKGADEYGMTYDIASLYNLFKVNDAAITLTVVDKTHEADNTKTDWVTGSSKIAISKKEMYETTHKLEVSYKYFNNEANKFVDVIYVTGKSPIKEGAIACSVKELSLAAGAEATLTSASFDSKDVFKKAYNLFDVKTVTTNANGSKTTTYTPGDDRIQSVVIEPTGANAGAITCTSVSEENGTPATTYVLGYKVAPVTGTQLQEGGTVELNVTITDTWGMVKTEKITLKIVK